MKYILWLIRFIIWFVISLFVISLQARLINLSQLQEIDGGCVNIIKGQELSGWCVLITSLIIALCISFMKNWSWLIKRMIWIYIIPFGIFYFVALISWIIEFVNISNIPLINVTSPNASFAFMVIYMIYYMTFLILILPEWYEKEHYGE